MISGSIDAINFSTPENDVEIFAILSVRNSGSPTILENWSISIKTINGNKYYGQNLTVPKVVILENPNGKEVEFTGQDAIYDKTIKKPISEGEMIRGLFLGGFKGIDEKILDHTGNEIYIKCSDINRKTYTFSYKLDGKRTNKWIYIPGLSSPK